MCPAEPNVQPFEEEATSSWTGEQQTEQGIWKLRLSPGSAPAALQGTHISHVTSRHPICSRGVIELTFLPALQ